MPLKLRIPHEVTAVIHHLHPQLKQKVRAALRTIQADPQTGKALKVKLAGLYSFRVNRFRIIYRIADDALEIITIGPRRTIYEETLRLIR
jgi:mRNA-degrading endonuclease RelE of RelBE toxin-antitoxin system